MNGATVSDPKSWVGPNLSYPAMVEELPGLEHQCKHSSIYGKPHVNTSKAPQFQENMVGEMVNIEDAFKFLDQMAYPPSADDIFCILQKCRKQKHLTYAKRVHEHICDIGLDAHKMLEGHFVPMFVECGSIHDAQHAFNRLVARDEYSWTYLIQGYINSGGLQHAFELFRRMQEDCVHPSRYTYVVLLKACAGMKCITRGREIHTEIAKEGYENDTFVRSTLVDIYMKIGSLAEAREVFDELQVRDVVLWTALIGGYAEQGLSEEALNCFEQMQQEGVSPDQVTYICSLKSCSSLGAVDTGQGIHGEIVKDGFEIDPYVGSALVGMYAKCGLLEEAQELLHELPMRGVVVWNALIAGYSEHGLGEEALKCLEQMRSDSVSPNDVTFVCSLKACGSTGAVQMGQEVHVQIVKQGFESDSFVGSILIDMYTKCGSLEEAHEVFKELAARDVVSWTTFIAGYVEHGFFEEALNCLEEMQVEGTSPDALTLACILNGCGSTRAIERGREAHIETVKRGLGGGPFISSTLVKMYAESGLFAEAQDVFNKLPVKDVMSWNALIGGLAEYGLGEEALNCMEQMRLEGPSIDATTFLNSLKACSCIEAAEKGFEVHSEIVKYGFEVDLFIGNILVDMYSKFGCLSEAQEVFDGLPGRGTVSWTALIAGHAEHGHGKEVLNCLEHMQVEGVPQDVVTFVCSLKACCSIGALNKGRELHNEIVNEGLESDTFLGSTLVDMYAKWGSLLEAQVILDELPVRNVVSWTAVIAAYAEQAHFEDAVRCLEQMQLEGVSPNAVTYVSVLKACSSTRVINKGREVHSEIVKVGIECKSLICSSLVDLYAKCGLLTESQEVFDMLSARDLLSWNVLIGGYAEHGHGQKALDCFKQMQVEGMNPDDVTYIYSLKACGSLGTIGIGQQIYTGIIKKGFDLNPFVSNSLVDMYAKRCAFLEARKVFDQLPIRDTVSWNPLIVGYFEQGLGQEALSCFEQMRLEGASPDVVSWNAVLLGCAEQGENERVFMMYAQMQEQGIPPNSATFVSIIKACGNTAAIELGEKFYAQFCRDGGLEATEIIMATALIDMYGKCGSMANAQQVFDTMPTKDPTMWNALITGYSRQGESEHALHLFERMKKEGTDPDAITFLCVLTVCNHAGLRDKAQEYFESMIKEYGIPSSIKHHNCMIDLLGRAGQLNDALMLLKQMPFQPNDATLNTLLGACRKWGNVEVGKQVFECAVRLDQKHAGAFVLMSNIYADVHMWEDSRKIEALRLNLQALKKPPKSWIEIGGVVQTFVADDTTHSQSQDIYAKLKHLSSKIEENLVTAGTHHVLVNLPMNTELDVSGGESENLAIACGLINTPEEKPLRIVKNSQVSDACHVTLAVVSKVERRTIFCRDASGFHVSKDGKCSCGG